MSRHSNVEGLTERIAELERRVDVLQGQCNYNTKKIVDLMADNIELRRQMRTEQGWIAVYPCVVCAACLAIYHFVQKL